MALVCQQRFRHPELDWAAFCPVSRAVRKRPCLSIEKNTNSKEITKLTVIVCDKLYTPVNAKITVIENALTDVRFSSVSASDDDFLAQLYATGDPRPLPVPVVDGDAGLTPSIHQLYLAHETVSDRIRNESTTE